MSALARILLAKGYEVSGSDLRGGATLEALSALGATVFSGHNPEVARTADLVVASSAVPEFDEELEAARDAGLPVWRRPQLLNALTADTPTLGATGTHGKTTTTALLITALRAVGLNPSFIIGGEISDLGTNGHLGTTDLLVVEADEAFRTFESIQLNGLVITNVEAEHLEHFGTRDDLVDSFTAVAEAVDGPVLACADDEGSSTVARRVDAVTYGFSDESDWQLSELDVSADGSVFSMSGGRRTVEVRLPYPGKHVALNAAGALALLADSGYDLDDAVQGLAAFRGVARRWDSRGTVRGVSLIDDYAHHPTEVRATLEAAGAAASGKVWAVFQPHLYSRTERFYQEFAGALSLADEIVVTDVYGAREEPVPGITGELIVDSARDLGATVHYVQHRADLVSFLVPRVEEGDMVISMGAGDITLLPGELASRLAGPL
jgi:UDP-N-acetylmuramate--alanine ligase